jgi:hypothetical protein
MQMDLNDVERPEPDCSRRGDVDSGSNLTFSIELTFAKGTFDKTEIESGITRVLGLECRIEDWTQKDDRMSVYLTEGSTF